MSAAKPASMLVCRFVAAVLERTIDITDDAIHQHAIQVFVNELRPWMPPVAGPFRVHAPLFAMLELDEKTGRVSSGIYARRPRLLPRLAAPPGTRSPLGHILSVYFLRLGY